MVVIASALRRRLSGQFTLRDVRLPPLIPGLLVVLLFKLAISDGGGHLPSLTFTQAAVLLTAGVVVWTKAKPDVGALRPLLATLVATGASLFWSVRPDSTLREFLLWSSYVAIFALVVLTLSGLAAARKFLDAAVVIVGWVCLVGLYLYWGSDGSIARWYSTFYWPNPFAAFILLVLPLEVVRCAHAREVREALAHGAMAVMLTVAFLLTQSRGAWLSLAAIMPLAAVLLRPPAWTAALRRMALVTILAIAMAVGLSRVGSQSVHSGILSRAASVADATDYSMQGRLHFWRAGLQIFLDHPLVGTGAGTYAYVLPQYQSDVRFYARNVHNLYLQFASELGLVGLIAFLAFLGRLATLWWRGLAKARSTEAYPLICGVGLGLTAFLIHSGVDMNFAFPANPALAFALAGVLAWYATGQVTPPQAQARISPTVWKSSLTILLMLTALASAVRLVAEQHFRQGQRLAGQRQWAAAVVDLQRAARLNPVNPDYVFAWGEAMHQVSPGSPDIVAAMRRGMALDPKNAYFPINLAGVLMEQDRDARSLDEAEALLRRGLRLNPYHYPQSYAVLARLLRQQGDHTGADRVYQDAMNRYFGQGAARDPFLRTLLWPRVSALFLEQARFLDASGRTDEAINLLRTLLGEDQTLVPAYLQLTSQLLRTGRRPEAAALLESGLQYVPNSEQIWVRWRTLPQHRSPVWER